MPVKTTLQLIVLKIITACGIQQVEVINNRTSQDLSSKNCAAREINIIANSIFNCQGVEIDDSKVNELSSLAWTQLNEKDHSKYNGLGRFGGCSATLIEPKSVTNSSPAYIITNGHCIIGTDMPPTGAKFDLEISKTMTFKYYNSTPVSERIVVDAKTVSYASMENTDVAIVELNSSLSALKSQGITAFKFATIPAKKGDKIKLIGVPQSGVNQDNLGLYGSSCTLGDTVALKEGQYSFNKSIRYQGCSMVGGNSGSSLLSFETNEIIGVNNTTATDADSSKSDCSLNRPCEVENNNKVNEGYNYGQSTHFVSLCFNSDGVFDTTQQECSIQKN